MLLVCLHKLRCGSFEAPEHDLNELFSVHMLSLSKGASLLGLLYLHFSFANCKSVFFINMYADECLCKILASACGKYKLNCCLKALLHRNILMWVMQTVLT